MNKICLSNVNEEVDTTSTEQKNLHPKWSSEFLRASTANTSCLWNKYNLYLNTLDERLFCFVEANRNRIAFVTNPEEYFTLETRPEGENTIYMPTIWGDSTNTILNNIRTRPLKSSNPSEYKLLSNLKKLEEFKKLNLCWDGYSANPISETAIQKARNILKNNSITKLRLSDLFVSPTSSGGIGFEWRLKSGKELLIEISIDGRVSFLLVEIIDGMEIETEGDIQELDQINEILEKLQ